MAAAAVAWHRLARMQSIASTFWIPFELAVAPFEHCMGLNRFCLLRSSKSLPMGVFSLDAP